MLRCKHTGRKQQTRNPLHLKHRNRFGSVVVNDVSLRALIWHISQCYSTLVTFQRFPVPWKVDSLSRERLRATHRCRFILSSNGPSAEPRQTCSFDLEGGRVCVKSDSHTNLPIWSAWRFSLQVAYAFRSVSQVPSRCFDVSGSHECVEKMALLYDVLIFKCIFIWSLNDASG